MYENHIADITLAPEGEKKIRWVAGHMPVLAAIAEDFRETKPLAGLRVALSVLAWGSTIVAVSTVIILQITKADVASVLFDVISGFATVGLSTGLTETLPESAKYVLAVTIVMGSLTHAVTNIQTFA